MKAMYSSPGTGRLKATNVSLPLTASGGGVWKSAMVDTFSDPPLVVKKIPASRFKASSWMAWSTDLRERHMRLRLRRVASWLPQFEEKNTTPVPCEMTEGNSKHRRPLPSGNFAEESTTSLGLAEGWATKYSPEELPTFPSKAMWFSASTLGLLTEVNPCSPPVTTTGTRFPGWSCAAKYTPIEDPLPVPRNTVPPAEVAALAREVNSLEEVETIFAVCCCF
mmetsp:Transcript_16978/g.32209  ORF Transcript_16978/g.32209 Transcript_16978/m.32209 type:complete len:222 (+) Transcript_16978:552-1217(+)